MRAISTYFRRLVLAWAIMAWASAAQAGVADRVSFSVPAKVIMSEILSKPGQQQFLIASNTPFEIFVKNTIGPMKVSVKSSGRLQGLSFGSAAQMPGVVETCKDLTSFLPSVIYRSNRKTALERGDVKSQSVLVTVNFDASAKPDLSVKIASRSNRDLPENHQLCS